MSFVKRNIKKRLKFKKKIASKLLGHHKKKRGFLFKGLKKTGLGRLFGKLKGSRRRRGMGLMRGVGGVGALGLGARTLAPPFSRLNSPQGGYVPHLPTGNVFSDMYQSPGHCPGCSHSSPFGHMGSHGGIPSTVGYHGY